MKLLHRYLVNEILSATLAATSVVVLLFLSNQWGRYLSRAASGKIPLDLLLQLTFQQLPYLLGLLLPLGFFLGILLGMGRLYADSEWVVVSASGMRPLAWLKVLGLMASMVALTVAMFMFFINPSISAAQHRLLARLGMASSIQAVMPQRLRTLPDHRTVYYVDHVSRDKKMQGIFVAVDVPSGAGGTAERTVLLAREGYHERDPKTQDVVVVLENGMRFRGTPGQADFELSHYGAYHLRMPTGHWDGLSRSDAIPSSYLFAHRQEQANYLAEWHWRLALPLSVLVLTCVAVPLVRIAPRAGRFAKLLPAILLYTGYAHLIYMGRIWLQHGHIPAAWGLWWVHGTMLAIAGLLVWRYPPL